MVDQHERRSALNFLVGLAAFIIVIAGLRAAQSLVVPFLISGFLAIICSGPLVWLQTKKVPKALALILVIAGAMIAFFFVVSIAGASIEDFVRNLNTPDGYQAKLEDRKQELVTWLAKHHVEIPQTINHDLMDSERLMRFFSGLLGSLGAVLSNAFLVLLTLIFMLLELAGFREKLLAMSQGEPGGVDRWRQISESIRHYMTLKTWLSLITGVLIGLWLKFLGVDYPLLWGLLAFLFNYVPNIGSILASVPALLLATIHPGLDAAIYAAIGYLVVNIFIGSVIEPRIMGKGLGLSTLVVFLSLVFWGWVLGPTGMVLSVPLTMILKIYLESSEDTRNIAILLSDEPRKTNPV
jgi:AI-2 transport protein TqsA